MAHRRPHHVEAVLLDDPKSTCCTNGDADIHDPRISYSRDAFDRNGRRGAMVAEGDAWVRVTYVSIHAEHCTESSPLPILSVCVNGATVAFLKGDALRAFAAKLAEVVAP